MTSDEMACFCGMIFDRNEAISQLIETGYSDWERHLDTHAEDNDDDSTN